MISGVRGRFPPNWPTRPATAAEVPSMPGMETVMEAFSDQQRRRLMQLVMAAIPCDHGDPELIAILSRLSGTDTVLIAQRAYPSQARKFTHG